jgi:hypothetical protein
MERAGKELSFLMRLSLSSAMANTIFPSRARATAASWS